MAVRSYPNNYFAWYNDDDRIAIVVLDTTSTSGEKTKEKYDTWQNSGDDITDGIRLTYRAKYEEVTSIDDDLKTNAGLDSGMHNSVLCYIKSRLYEDSGNFEQAQYFRKMYEIQIKKFRSRRSGVRQLAVSRL